MFIRELEESEKPRERAKSYGHEALSNTELIALILRTGSSQLSALEIASLIMDEAKSISELRSYSISKLNKFHGMGDAKSISLLAALELGNRFNRTNNDYKCKSVNDPNEIFTYLSKYKFNTDHEEFYIICLNMRREVIESKLLFKGTVDSSIIHPREIYKFAVGCSASYVVFAHNHPSRNLTPSKEDIDVTRKLIECGNILNIKVLDHLIFSDIGFCSLREIGEIT